MRTNCLIYTLLMASFFFGGCKEKKGASTPNSDIIPVTVMKVEKKKVQKEISVSGNTEGNRTVRLGFMVAGKINYMIPHEGQKVAQNQLVASLDPENYAIAKELSDIQVNQVQDEYDRLKGMHDTKSISEGDFAKIGFGLQQAKAQQKLQAKNLAETRLYSPISGVLLKKLAETGEITGTGIPVLVISDISTIKVSAYIPENELHLIRTGQAASVKIASFDPVFSGKVTEVGSVADPAARAFTVKIEISNPDLIIRPGMIAEIKLTAGETEEVVEVPVETVLHDFNNQSYVYVVDEQGGKAFKRDVSLGRLSGNQIELVSGINEGEIIVTGGQNKLTDGIPVTFSK